MEDKNLKDAQYRKSLSIAFFNATNAAIEIVKNKVYENDVLRQEDIVAWRDWLLTEHRDYYAKTIANVGVSYRAEDTIKRLGVAKTYDELKEIWLVLSEDERRDGEILKVVAKLKKSYEKA